MPQGPRRADETTSTAFHLFNPPPDATALFICDPSQPTAYTLYTPCPNGKYLHMDAQAMHAFCRVWHSVNWSYSVHVWTISLRRHTLKIMPCHHNKHAHTPPHAEATYALCQVQRPVRQDTHMRLLCWQLTTCALI